MLGYFFDPVRRCCVSEEAPCVRGMSRGENPMEIFDESPAVPSSVEVLEGRAIHGSLPAGPKERVIRTFATSEEEPLRGHPTRSGHILQLKLGVAIEDVTFSLYVNGFRLTPCGEPAPGEELPQPHSRVWSPFSLVEKCQVKTMQHASLWAVFKLTIFRQEGDDRYYYFATTGKDAFKERDQWVEEISNAIRQVTVSLFPPHLITVRPVPGVESTCTRIMAGYLLRSQARDNVMLTYCELHAYAGGEARLAIYKDEWCEREISSLLLTDQTVVSTRKGSYCTVFGVDTHRFCARTREEKELWLRAVSNIKVKLMFDAPDPTAEELQIFRAAVQERVVKLEGVAAGPEDQAGASPNVAAWDPLLPQLPRPPLPMSPRGDVWHPEEIDEAYEMRVNSMLAFEAAGRKLAAAGNDLEAKPSDPAQPTSPPPTGDEMEVPEPEECRKLLASVTMGDCGASFDKMDTGSIPREQPGGIRTVHVSPTEKSLMSPVAPPEGCNNLDPGEDLCSVTCPGSGVSTDDNGGRKARNDKFQTAGAQNGNDGATTHIPLLMWSPGR